MFASAVHAGLVFGSPVWSRTVVFCERTCTATASLGLYKEVTRRAEIVFLSPPTISIVPTRRRPLYFAPASRPMVVSSTKSHITQSHSSADCRRRRHSSPMAVQSFRYDSGSDVLKSAHSCSFCLRSLNQGSPSHIRTPRQPQLTYHPFGVPHRR